MRKPNGMEAQLFEDTKKRFQQICEYTVIGNTIDEADKDNDQQMPPMDGNNDNNQPPMGDNAPMPNDQQMPPTGGLNDNPQMSPMDPDANQPQGGDMTAGFNPQPQTPEMPQDNPDMPSEEDNVVDITDITDAQDETKEKIEDLDEKFAAVMQKLDAFEDFIKNNDEKIENLKAEYERRNPTTVEKMSMNTAKGGPFNVDPEQYWDEKEKEGVYSRESDNNGKDMPEYTITANDIESADDWRNIAKSLDDDFIFNQTLENALKL